MTLGIGPTEGYASEPVNPTTRYATTMNTHEYRTLLLRSARGDAAEMTSGNARTTAKLKITTPVRADASLPMSGARSASKSTGVASMLGSQKCHTNTLSVAAKSTKLTIWGVVFADMSRSQGPHHPSAYSNALQLFT